MNMKTLFNKAKNEAQENKTKYKFNAKCTSVKALKPYDNKEYLYLVGFTLNLLRNKTSEFKGVK